MHINDASNAKVNTGVPVVQKDSPDTPYWEMITFAALMAVTMSLAPYT